MVPQQENIVNCPACGQPMDVSLLPPYANAICPGCQALTRVKTRMGPYRITGKLGKGGMSVVFRAEDAVLGREVALKVLNDTYAGDALRCERFEREALLALQSERSRIAWHFPPLYQLRAARVISSER